MANLKKARYETSMKKHKIYEGSSSLTKKQKCRKVGLTKRPEQDPIVITSVYVFFFSLYAYR
jgi:hypothetical protein